jgi:hypothetical protein
MASFHCTTKPISRSHGRSAVAAAAYRAGAKLIDERTGLVHNYTKKAGVVSAVVITPDGGTVDRSALWNAAEAAEKRKDSRTAREWLIAIPHELNEQQRTTLAHRFGTELAKRYNVAVDVAIHLPSEDGDERNHHAHVLTTTRQFMGSKAGVVILGNKASLELADTKRRALGIGSGYEEVTVIRQLWEKLANEALEYAGYLERIDARSYKTRGIDREATTHLGPVASQMERSGLSSDRGNGNRKALAASNERAVLSAEIIDLDAERKRRQEEERLNQLSTVELKAAINEARPSSLSSLIENDPLVIAEKNKFELLNGQYWTLQQETTQRELKIAEWRKKHALKAKMHDSGYWPSAYLIEQQKALEKALEALAASFIAIDAAEEALAHQRRAADWEWGLKRAEQLEYVKRLEDKLELKLEKEREQEQLAELLQLENERYERERLGIEDDPDFDYYP